MILDFTTFDSTEPITCDVCIAGAGAAGITLALEFAGGTERVVVLESGGFEFEDAVQDLYKGRNVGQPYFDLDVPRMRFFGGATNHWGGMCTRFEPIDLARRDWVAHSGWPIGMADLEPYYQRAHPLLELGRYNYVPAEIAPEGTEFLPFRPERIQPKMWRYSMPITNFGQAYREPLQQARNVDVLLHANLVEIEIDDAGRRVSGFRIATLDGRTTQVQARVYVLALGGIENPRLLLNSDRVLPGGVGNQNDLVGRFFMEHIGIIAGRVMSVEGDWNRAYTELFRGERQVRCGLTLSPELQEREGLVNPMLMFGEKSVERPKSEGYKSLGVLRGDLGRGQLPDDLGEHLLNVVTDLDGVVRGMLEKVDTTVWATMEAEQSPNPDSRVGLSEERDPLGLRRVALAWRLSAIDKRSARRLGEVVGEELGRLGVGRMQLEEWLTQEEPSWSEEIRGHHHHMGTTRMATDASQGVVDPDCRVFGTDNLYVAGSSVFVTGGCANPTLTLVALALRLADHLKTLPA